MSGFALLALLLLVVATIFSLSNPSVVVLRFLVWQTEISIALAVIGGAVLGGLLVFISGLIGQQHLRARVRDLQARLREAEAKVAATEGAPKSPP
jgi:uncharacterized integral membrane protein